jgi:site-specific recombinase XerD
VVDIILLRSLHCPTVASLYPRKRSRFWWIEYIDAAGKRRQESTKLRRDVAAQTRKARDLCRELTKQEAAQAGNVDGVRSELWASWVPRFIAQRYGSGGLGTTRERYDTAWRNLEAFLRAHEIAVPRQLARQQVRDYVAWRKTARPELGVHKAAKNTALLEIKFLGTIMDEAVESGFCHSNPCRKLGIKRDKAKSKPKIEIKEHRLITRALKREAEWMRVSYKIAWEQGCRFSETCFPLSDVDLARNVVGFRTKGEKETVAEFPLSPRLRPLLRRLIREGKKRTFEMPKWPAKQWFYFFRKLKLGHLCFHSTRVSFVTRCYEAGIPREHVMRLAGHASTLAHEIYPRVSSSSELLQQLRRLVA